MDSSQNINDGAGQLALQKPMANQQAVVLRTQAGSEMAMAKLASVRADFVRKRKALDHSIDRAADLEKALEKNAAERQQLIAEVAALADGDDDEVDCTESEVEDLEAQITSLKGKLKASEQEYTRVLREEYTWVLRQESATRGALQFLLAKGFGYDFDLDHSEDMVRLMATAKWPQDANDISNHRHWIILPPWITGIGLLPDVPKMELEMVLKLHALLSRYYTIELTTLSEILMLISKLVSGLPSSEFDPITAAFPSIWDLTRDARVKSTETGHALLQLAMRELGLLILARFGTLGVDDLLIRATPALKNSPLIAALNHVILKADRHGPDGDVQAAMVSVLEKFSSIDRSNDPKFLCSFYFHHDTTTNTAWFATSAERFVLLLDFANSGILAVDKSLCVLEISRVAPHRVDLHIKGPCQGDEGMWVRKVSSKLKQWFGQVGIGA